MECGNQLFIAAAKADPGTVGSRSRGIGLRIGGRDSSGAVSSLIIRGEDREVQLTKSRIRAVLGSSLVRSAAGISA